MVTLKFSVKRPSAMSRVDRPHVIAALLIAVALAALLLFLPVSTLLWSLFNYDSMESAEVLMYGVMAAVMLAIFLLVSLIGLMRPGCDRPNGARSGG